MASCCFPSSLHLPRRKAAPFQKTANGESENGLRKGFQTVTSGSTDTAGKEMSCSLCRRKRQWCGAFSRTFWRESPGLRRNGSLPRKGSPQGTDDDGWIPTSRRLSQTARIQETFFCRRNTFLTPSAKNAGRTEGSFPSILCRNTMRPSLTGRPSGMCRKKWKGERNLGHWRTRV